MEKENYNYDDENIDQKNEQDFVNEQDFKSEDEVLNLDDKPEEEKDFSDDEFDENQQEEEEEFDDENLEAENKRLKAENIKMEQIIKRKKKQGKWSGDEKGKEKLQTNNETDLRTESYLFAQGLNIDDVDYVNKIAKVEGVTLIDAYKSDIFQLYKEKKEKEKISRQASLQANSRAGLNRKKDISDYGISDEDHKKMFQKSNR